MSFLLGRAAKLIWCNATFLLAVLLLCVASSHAQATDAKATAPSACANEIPTGVKVVRLPDADQRKVTISEFSISTNKDASTYDLAMHVKNGTDNWCITSFAFVYSLGDARGQEWTANEYPAVLNFKTQADAVPVSTHKSKSAIVPVPHNVGIAPGKDEKRMVFNLYNYIQPRPSGFFDGFHLISAEIKFCMGYMLTQPK